MRSQNIASCQHTHIGICEAIAAHRNARQKQLDGR